MTAFFFSLAGRLAKNVGLNHLIWHNELPITTIPTTRAHAGNKNDLKTEIT